MACIDDKKGQGWIEGIAEKVCLEGLERLAQNALWQIDKTTLKHSAVDGFQAKYYKYIQGGHRIDFKLQNNGQ
jgi:hypothetical protein